MTAFSEVKAQFEEAVRVNGDADCPCCGRKTAVYQRVIKRTMARQLLKMYRSPDWISNAELQVGITDSSGREFQKLSYWGLAECGKRGWWKITSKGEKFVRGETEVPQIAFVVANRPIGFSDATIDFASCLHGANDRTTHWVDLEEAA